MKILAIRGRNLASLDGDFSIDFTQEPLLSAGIFAISGPTGSGKSTLLDAMCLALFARTPRTSQAKENNVRLQDVNNEVLPQSDPRFLLRRGTASGYAEVDFQALDGHHYRARWAVSRARNKENGRLQNPTVTLHSLSKEKEEQGSRSDLQNRIIELIGLTFEQFTRAVLLAQNDFSTFLKAEQSEKAALLEKLTGTEIYSSVSRKIFERNNKAREAYDLLRMRLQGIELLSEEDVTVLKDQFEKIRERKDQLEKAQKELQTQEEALRANEKQIAEKQRQQQEVKTQMEEAERSYTDACKQAEQTEAEKNQTEARNKAMQPEMLEARKLDAELEALAREAKKVDEQLIQSKDQLKKAQENYQKILNETSSLEVKLGKLNLWFEKYRAKAGIAEQFSALALLLQKAGEAYQGIAQSQKKQEQLKPAYEKIQQNQKQIAEASDRIKKEIEQTGALQKRLDDELKKQDMGALSVRMEEIRTARERMLLAFAKDVQQLRTRLEPEIPCPVCGSTSHPYAEVASALKTDEIDRLSLQLKGLDAQKNQYEKDTQKFIQLQQALAELHQSLTRFSGDAEKLQGERALTESKIQSEQQQIIRMEEQLAEALQDADKLFGNSGWQIKWKEDPVAFRNTLAGFVQEWQQNSTALQQLQPLLSASKATVESQAAFLPGFTKAAEEAQALADQLQARKITLAEQRKKLLDGQSVEVVEQQQSRALELQHEKLKKLMIVQTEQTARFSRLKGTAEQLQKDLQQLGEENIKWKNEITDWQTKYQSILGEQPLKILLDEAQQQFTGLQFRLQKQIENQALVAGMQKDLTACQEESERWSKLNDLAGSSDGAKFRRIAQGYTLEVLVNYANVQLKELTRRYQLARVPDTLALQVIDHDMCDEIRSVHSLSGGESFLVSLALALGLSSLSSNRMKVESLFIDEGFGSLDAETLRVAMDALENLRTQGRKIGVISHVQEMTERISVQIRVSRSGNGRSSLEIIG